MKVFLVFILTETSLATNSYSYFFFFWSANYANLYILEVSRYINIVYMGRFFVLTYIERLFSTVCCFFSYISWSVNCKSWVSKFHHFFLGCLETKARFIFEGFKHCLLWKVHFQLSSIFFSSFHLVCKLSKGFFRLLFQSVNSMRWVIYVIYVCVHVIYLGDVLIYTWDLVVLLFTESSICTICTISEFF